MSQKRSRLNFRKTGKTRKGSLVLTFSTVIYFILAIMWLEFAFHFVMVGSFDLDFFYPLLFAIPIGGFFGLLCNLTPSKRANYIITIALTLFCCVVFGANMVYHDVFQTYIGVFSSLVQGNAGNALGFGPFFQLAVKTMWDDIFGIILLIIPFVFILTIGRYLLSFRQRNLPTHGVVAAGVVISHLICLLIINFGSHDPYTAYDLYHNQSSLEDEVETLGVATAMRMDLKNVIFGSSSSSLDGLILPEGTNAWGGSGGSGETQAEGETQESGTEAPTEPETEPDPHDLYNFVDIDFDTLIEEADSDTVKQMHQYFASQTPTNKNEYTGIYEGYNLIFITAEGFSPYAVDEELTPTLYKLVNTGYVFNNFYTPLWYGSTSAGEYVNLTSQFPQNGGYVSLQETGKRGTDMYFSLGRMMERAGYNLWGFHNNSYTYYDRNLSFPNMGYNWIGSGNGYDAEKNSSGKDIWPQSDLRLIDTTFDTYKDSEPFHVYYMTVSGHVQYTFTGNSMSLRNRDAVESLPYSDEAKAYIACNIELDKAMESLINKLEESGLADRTLVVLSADHIPYDNKEICDEIAGHTLEDNFEWYQNNLIIWTGSMTENVIVDKPCYSLDILPTIANMLGLDYDSRILMGRDIFSDTEGMVIFQNRSWITETAMYNASTGEITSMTGEEVSQEYIDQMNTIVSNRLRISPLIVEENYYQYLHD